MTRTVTHIERATENGKQNMCLTRKKERFFFKKNDQKKPKQAT